MDVSVFSAIIGVFGTIIGTVVGWILGKIRIGNLKFRIRVDYSLPHYSNHSGGKNEVLTDIDLRLSVAVQNTKETILVIRNPRLLIFKDKKQLYSVSLKDLENVKSFSGVFHYFGEFATINIVGKEAIDLEASAYIPKEHVKDANKLFFCYTNERFKDKRIFIEKINCSNFPFRK